MPQISPQKAHQKAKNSAKENHLSRNHHHTEVEYHGITVKEYFRLCDQLERSKQMEQIQQQSNPSSQQSTSKTPVFGGHKNQGRKLKMKTEVEEKDQEQIFEFRKMKKKNNRAYYPILGQKMSSTVDQKGLLLPSYQNTKKLVQQKPQRMVSIPSKNGKDFLNKSALSSFYKMEKNKKNMLNKIKKQKQKVKEMKLSDAFFITKYGSKFNLNKNNLK